MTEVEFFTGVAEPLDFACRLLRKAYRKGARLLVTAPPEIVQALDRALWTFDEREFVPHIKIDGPVPLAAKRTPVWLSAQPNIQDAHEGAPDVLINLGADAPAELAAISRLSRLIEIVSHEADEAQRGRQRWRHYRELGLAIKHHKP